MKKKTRKAIDALLAAIQTRPALYRGEVDQFDPEVLALQQALREEDNV